VLYDPLPLAPGRASNVPICGLRGPRGGFLSLRKALARGRICPLFLQTHPADVCAFRACARISGTWDSTFAGADRVAPGDGAISKYEAGARQMVTYFKKQCTLVRIANHQRKQRPREGTAVSLTRNSCCRQCWGGYSCIFERRLGLHSTLKLWMVSGALLALAGLKFSTRNGSGCNVPWCWRVC
jgi:hypothetical protein